MVNIYNNVKAIIAIIVNMLDKDKDIIYNNRQKIKYQLGVLLFNQA